MDTHIENKFTRTRARFTLGKKLCLLFLQIFQLMLGQKFEIILVATFIDFKNFTLRTSVFHYLDPFLPLLKSGHEKLRARVLVNLFSMDTQLLRIISASSSLLITLTLLRARSYKEKFQRRITLYACLGGL